MAAPERTLAQDGALPRTFNIALGLWLFISAFLWTHGFTEFTNTWVCGVLTVMFALFALGVAGARYLNTVVGIWLIVSAIWLLQGSAATVWNNALVGIAIFIVSLVRGGVPAGSYGTSRLPRNA